MSEIDKLKKEIKLLKLNMFFTSAARTTIDDFRRGKYGIGDKKYFEREWEKLMEDAEELALLENE